MTCTQEKCPIKEVIGSVKRCTMHNCSYRTNMPSSFDVKVRTIEYPGLVEGSKREKKVKRFIEENELPLLANTENEILVVNPEKDGESSK